MISVLHNTGSHDLAVTWTPQCVSYYYRGVLVLLLPRTCGFSSSQNTRTAQRRHQSCNRLCMGAGFHGTLQRHWDLFSVQASQEQSLTSHNTMRRGSTQEGIRKLYCYLTKPLIQHDTGIFLGFSINK